MAKSKKQPTESSRGEPTAEEQSRLKDVAKHGVMAAAPGPRIGGSFAPPLTDELLSKYEEMVNQLKPSPVKDGMTTLLNCCNVWWDLPEPDGNNQRSAHPVGVGTIVRLSDEHIQELWDHIPWSKRSTPESHDSELESIGAALETIDPIKDRDLRNAAFHLLWHVHEFDLDREPLTSDQLPGS